MAWALAVAMAWSMLIICLCRFAEADYCIRRRHLSASLDRHLVAKSDVQLFTALARKAELCISKFNAQDLANTAWSFATAGQPDP